MSADLAGQPGRTTGRSWTSRRAVAHERAPPRRARERTRYARSGRPRSWTGSGNTPLPGAAPHRGCAAVPWVPRHGADVGRWLASQRRSRDRLDAEQQRRLAELGVKKVRSAHIWLAMPRGRGSSRGRTPAARAAIGVGAAGGTRSEPPASPGTPYRHALHRTIAGSPALLVVLASRRQRGAQTRGKAGYSAQWRARDRKVKNW